MAADQLVKRGGAPAEVVEGVGRLRYVVSPDHRHWHLLHFDRYELRRAGGTSSLVRDRKTGFCLGDRYAMRGRNRPAGPPEYTHRCGLRKPELLGVTQGISVGYGDNYEANLEGQYLPLNGLPSGRYVLVHRANAARRLREVTYRKNAASVLLALRRREGTPTVRVIGTCPGTAHCRR